MLLTLNDEAFGGDPKDAAAAPRTIVVFGCGRGGTSATAGVLRTLGVAFPDRTHPLKHESSPLRHENGALDRDASRRAIAQLDARHDVWGWKSPGDLFSVGGWISMVRAPRFLVVFRNPIETIRSIVRHEGVPAELAAAHVGEVTAELGRFVAFTPFPVAMLSYETLCGEPARTVAAIADWAGLGTDAARLHAAAAFVSRETRGYQPLAATAVQEINEAERAADRRAAQRALFSDMARQLGSRADTLDADITLARDIASRLAASVGAATAAFPADPDCEEAPIEPVAGADGETAPLRAAYARARARHAATLRQRIRLQAEIDELASRRA